MTTCAWPPCGRDFEGRKGQRYHSRSCAGKANGGKRGSPVGTVETTMQRRALLETLRAGAATESALALAVYGADDTASRYALRMLIWRSTAYLRREGVHIDMAVTRTYTLGTGYRLRGTE